jgi:hypothetical protein
MAVRMRDLPVVLGLVMRLHMIVVMIMIAVMIMVAMVMGMIARVRSHDAILRELPGSQHIPTMGAQNAPRKP